MLKRWIVLCLLMFLIPIVNADGIGKKWAETAKQSVPAVEFTPHSDSSADSSGVTMPTKPRLTWFCGPKCQKNNHGEKWLYENYTASNSDAAILWGVIDEFSNRQVCAYYAMKGKGCNELQKDNFLLNQIKEFIAKRDAMIMSMKSQGKPADDIFLAAIKMYIDRQKQWDSKFFKGDASKQQKLPAILKQFFP